MGPLVMYIDAGTGSMLLAAIASGATGLWFFIRSKWYGLMDKFRKQDPSASEADPKNPANS